jgi:hypothetical protein
MLDSGTEMWNRKGESLQWLNFAPNILIFANRVAREIDALTLVGLFAVSAMSVCYALEGRSHRFVLLFAVSCALGSVYGFPQAA